MPYPGGGSVYPSANTFPGGKAGPGTRLEVEFVAGTWTDVTADLDYNAGVSVRVGRTSPQQAPQVSSVSFSLRNPTGKYTPGLAVLSDGTAAPYFPNVTPRKRVRYSNTAGVRFLGFIQSWSPTLDNGVAGRCTVQAVDRFDQLSRIELRSPLPQEVFADAPIAYWPLTDASITGGTAAEMSGKGVGSLHPAGNLTSSPQPAFGAPGVPGMGGTAVTFTGTSDAIIESYGATTQAVGKTIEVWVRTNDQTASTSKPAVVWRGSDRQAGNEEWLGTVGGTPGGNAAYDPLLLTSTQIADGSWHQMVVVYDSPVVGQVQFYLDGALVGTAPASLDGIALNNVFVGGYVVFATGLWQTWNGVIGPITVYQQSLSAARILNHYKAGFAWFGETVDTRLARLLGYAGLTSADWTLDASNVAMSGYDPGGKDVVSACQDMAETESGGSAFYILGGSARFTNRRYRKPAAPALTLDAVTSVDRGTFTPAIDSQSLTNSVAVSRANESGTLTTVVVNDSNSIATYGLYSGRAITTYTSSDADALAVAQYELTENRTPAYRLPQISVDLLTAETSLYAALQNVQIGSRLRITSLPAASAPATTVDVIVEGWTETATINSYLVTFDTSPADTPAAGIFDDTSYGRYQAIGTTLNAAVAATGTTLTVATTSGNPTFTTTAGSYPLTVQIDGERITLTAAPGGATSPQTFTGITRGVGGTAAGPHAAGAAVTVYQPASYAL